MRFLFTDAVSYTEPCTPIMSWCFRTSPSSSLSVLANEPPLYVRRKKLIQYSLKLSSNPQNPTYNTVFNSKFEVSFDRKPHQIPPLGIRIQPDLHAVGFLGETFWNIQFRLLLLGCLSDRILTIVFISLRKTTPQKKSIEISSSSFVIITRIFLDYTQMALGWGTK